MALLPISEKHSPTPEKFWKTYVVERILMPFFAIISSQMRKLSNTNDILSCMFHFFSNSLIGTLIIIIIKKLICMKLHYLTSIHQRKTLIMMFLIQYMLCIYIKRTLERFGNEILSKIII